jgi:hypothetical protein
MFFPEISGGAIAYMDSSVCAHTDEAKKSHAQE